MLKLNNASIPSFGHGWTTSMRLTLHNSDKKYFYGKRVSDTEGIVLYGIIKKMYGKIAFF